MWIRRLVLLALTSSGIVSTVGTNGWTAEASWSYDRLMQEADLVVAARPVTSTRVELDLSHHRDLVAVRDPQLRREVTKHLGLFRTTFAVQGVLAGRQLRNIEVIHFCWRQPPAATLRTTFLDFLPPTMAGSHAVQHADDQTPLMLFLRRSSLADNLWEPVSGQWTPHYSVRGLGQPSLLERPGFPGAATEATPRAQLELQNAARFEALRGKSSDIADIATSRRPSKTIVDQYENLIGKLRVDTLNANGRNRRTTQTSSRVPEEFRFEAIPELGLLVVHGTKRAFDSMSAADKAKFMTLLENCRATHVEGFLRDKRD